MIDPIKKKEIVSAYITAITASDDVETKIHKVCNMVKDLSPAEVIECREEAVAFIYSEPSHNEIH